jgi:uncharacterized protein (DUF2235 family)
MLHAVGLIRPGTENLIPYAVQYWRNSFTPTGAKIASDFKQTMARECKVHFVGVWDTVGSVGWFNNFQTFPYTHRNPDVCIFRHAISIDERRCCFRQNVFEPDLHLQNQDVQNVWFAGVHADVGGGYKEAESGLSQITFEWMAREAQAGGLIMDQKILAIQLGREPSPVGTFHSKPDSNGIIHKSLCGFWWIIELLPRKTWNAAEKRMSWSWGPAKPRHIGENPSVHISVTERKRQVIDYTPVNLPKVFTSVE